MDGPSCSRCCLHAPASRPFLPPPGPWPFLHPLLSLLWIFLSLWAHCGTFHLIRSPWPFIPHQPSPISLLALTVRPIRSCLCSPAFPSPPPEPVLSNQASVSLPSPLKCFWSKRPQDHHRAHRFPAFLCLWQCLADPPLASGNAFFTWPPGH